jgi:hypothetical protein
MLIEKARDLRILERLPLHHAAPMAGAEADRQEDRLLLGLRLGERLFPPRGSVHRVVGVLEQAGETVLSLAGWSQ